MSTSKTSTTGMNIRQAISMLMALEAQGATKIRIAINEDGDGKSTGIDWISEKPIDGVGYLGCMPTWEYMDNKALQSLDW